MWKAGSGHFGLINAVGEMLVFVRDLKPMVAQDLKLGVRTVNIFEIGVCGVNIKVCLRTDYNIFLFL